MSEKIDGIDHHKWQCVLRKCHICPKYNVPEEESKCDDDAPTINFHIYRVIRKCKKHGILPGCTKSCEQCQSEGTIYYRKELVKVAKPGGKCICGRGRMKEGRDGEG